MGNDKGRGIIYLLMEKKNEFEFKYIYIYKTMNKINL